MRKKEPDYKKVYAKFFDLVPDDVLYCDACGSVAVDLHHILFKSRGGKNNIENLIALCRSCHDRAHGIKSPRIYPEYLFSLQRKKIDNFKQK